MLTHQYQKERERDATGQKDAINLLRMRITLTRKLTGKVGAPMTVNQSRPTILPFSGSGFEVTPAREDELRSTKLTRVSFEKSEIFTEVTSIGTSLKN